MDQENFVELIREIVRVELENLNVLKGDWHLGTVDTVVNTKQLNAFIDGSPTSQLVGCNPNITFSVSDPVWVIFVNGNSKDKFVLSKRAI
jgi:hypothetical protein